MSDFLFNPRSVAIIGASAKPGKVGHEILVNLLNGKFDGPIVPVNPTATEICGVKCYSSLNRYNGKIVLSIVAVPPPSVFQAVKDSISQGARAIIVVTAGFREVDADGLEMETGFTRLCKENGVKLLGPNCLGVINPFHNMNASFASRMPSRGSISVMSQSGALCTAILDWAASKKLGLSKLVSMGNKADMDESEFLQYLATDKQTKVIVCYLESINDGKRFVQTAQYASSQKPVVIFKSGVTRAGGKAASSHTGSLAGEDVAYGAAFRRSGVVRADTFESMFDYGMVFAMQPLPNGNRVAIITNAGGPGIMAADAVELCGMQLRPLETTHATALAATLPMAASVSNPIDVLGDADSGRYVNALLAAQDDDSIDAILVILTPQAMSNPIQTAVAIADNATSEKPILVSFMGGMDVMAARESLIAHNIPEYPSPERAVNALKAMWDYSCWLKRPSRVLTRFPANRRRVERVIKRQRRIGQLQLGESAAKEILSAYKFASSTESVDELRFRKMSKFVV